MYLIYYIFWSNQFKYLNFENFMSMIFLPFCPDSTKVVGQLMMSDRWVGGSVVPAPRGDGRTTWSWSVTGAGPNTTTPTSLLWSDRPCSIGGTAWRRTIIRPRSNIWRGRESCRQSRERERVLWVIQRCRESMKKDLRESVMYKIIKKGVWCGKSIRTVRGEGCLYVVNEMDV